MGTERGAGYMLKTFVLTLMVTASLPAAAQTWKWVDERGVVNYGEKPPANRQALPVDTQPGGTLESGDLQQKRYEAGLRRRDTAVAPQPQPAVPAEEPVRGMRFDTFVRLDRGMSEAELLLRAGRPDQESIESFHRFIIKSYYYYPTTYHPFLTVVTLRGGRIVALERTRKTF